MKKYISITLFFGIIHLSNVYSQAIQKADSLGLPGDNLNLYAVLDLFQQSETFEEFEKKLNDENSKVNNLDLNRDGRVDYISVMDHQQGKVHTVVLRVSINKNENQDIAVIEIEKKKDGKVQVQIIGNEALYGKNYIVEPHENDPAKKDELTNSSSENLANKDVPKVEYVYVNHWHVINYLYSPRYFVYVSPFHWGLYPAWWQAWRPWNWHEYNRYHWRYFNHYHGCFHNTNINRNPIADYNYGPRKSTSEIVKNNNARGFYNTTYRKENRLNEDGKEESVNPSYRENRSANQRMNERETNKSSENNHITKQNKNWNTNVKQNYVRQEKIKQNRLPPRTSTNRHAKPSGARQTSRNAVPATRHSNTAPHNAGGGMRK